MTTTTAAPLPPPPPSADGRLAYRLFRGLEELPGMAAANQAMRRHVGLLEMVDADALRHRYTHLVNSDPLTDCVIATRDGGTVGYARVEWHDLTDGDRLQEHTIVVDPAAWGLGITGTCLAWSEARLREVAAANPTDRRAWFGTYVLDGDTELEGELLAHGYTAVRWDAEMLRDTLDDLPDVPAVPDGYELRPVPPDRIRDVADMLTLAFRDHWGETEESEGETADWLENPRFDPDLLSVVWHGDAPASVVSAQVQDHADGRPIGYVDAVATHPDHRRRGLARVALADSLHRLAARGQTRAYLGVDTDNQTRAFALYEEAGFRRYSGSTSYRKPFDRQEPTP